MVQRLQQAARVADFEMLSELIKGMPPEHATLADDLQRLLDSYAYDRIERYFA